MSNSQHCVTDLARMLDTAVTDIRNQGFTREAALNRAAAWFGLSPARVKAMVYGRAHAAPDHERIAIRRRYLDHLDSQAKHFEARLAAIKERRRQLETDL